MQTLPYIEIFVLLFIFGQSYGITLFPYLFSELRRFLPRFPWESSGLPVHRVKYPVLDRRLTITDRYYNPQLNPYNPDFWKSSAKKQNQPEVQSASSRSQKSFDNLEDFIEERQTDNANCYVQTCDQRITGRMLSYNRALEIVQDEEYLTAADLDIIRRQSNLKARSSKKKSKLVRKKRQTGPGATPNGLLDLFGDITLSQDEWCDRVRESSNLPSLINNHCQALFNNELCNFRCPTGTILVGENCVQKDPAPAAQQPTIKAACEAKNGRLYEPRDQTAYFQVFKPTFLTSGTDCWIGLVRDTMGIIPGLTLDKFAYETEQTLFRLFTDWISGEPDNGAGGGDEGCVVADMNGWSDTRCPVLHQGFCEYSTSIGILNDPTLDRVCAATNVVTGEDVLLSFQNTLQDAVDACVEYTTIATEVCFPESSDEEEDSLSELLDSLGEMAQLGAIGVGVSAGASLASTPSLQMTTESMNPPGTVSPGAAGGGGLPSAATATQLALVPVGLTAVAVFPPFATDRTFPAEAVIFLENPNVNLVSPGASMTLRRRRLKRSLLKYVSKVFFKRHKQIIQRRSGHRHCHKSRLLWTEAKSFAQWVVGTVSHKIGTLKRTMKLIDKNMMCMKARLMALANHRRMRMLSMASQYEQRHRRPENKQRLRPKSLTLLKAIRDSKVEFKTKLKNFKEYVKDESNDEELEDLTIDSLDDCIDGIEEPLYGFRVNVTLIDNEACILGETCRATLDGEQVDIDQEVADNDIEDVGNVDYSDSNDHLEFRHRQSRSVFQRRQSGEEFNSDASPDCRVSFNPSGDGCTLRRNYVPLLTRLSSKLSEIFYNGL